MTVLACMQIPHVAIAVARGGQRFSPHLNSSRAWKFSNSSCDVMAP